MAGLGFKDFQVGEVLTSSDVDGYLMQQTVMRFADAGARGSALGTASGTAVALAEGMLSYLDDVNQVQVYNGTDWTAAGRIAQVVQTTLTSTVTVSSASFADVAGLSVAITPSSTTSKVLVLAQLDYSTAGGAGFAGFFRLTGGNSSNFVGDAAGGRVRSLGHTGQGGDGWQTAMQTQTAVYLDSPATTSAVTYKVQVRGNATPSAVYVNRAGTDTNASNYPRGASSITAIEVLA